MKGRCVCTVNKRGEMETGAEPCQEIFSDCQGATVLDSIKKIWTKTTLSTRAIHSQSLPVEHTCMPLEIEISEEPAHSSLYKV